LYKQSKNTRLPYWGSSLLLIELLFAIVAVHVLARVGFHLISEKNKRYAIAHQVKKSAP
jgi:hypothetical protein